MQYEFSGNREVTVSVFYKPLCALFSQIRRHHSCRARDTRQTGQKQRPPSECGCAVSWLAQQQLNTKLHWLLSNVLLPTACPPGVRGSPKTPLTCTRMIRWSAFVPLPLCVFAESFGRSILDNDPCCQFNIYPTCVPSINPDRKTVQCQAPPHLFLAQDQGGVASVPLWLWLPWKPRLASTSSLAGQTTRRDRAATELDGFEVCKVNCGHY